MKKLIAIIVPPFIVAYISFMAAHAAIAPAVDSRRLTIEQLIAIKHPSSPLWSPDGRNLAFMWDRAGVSNWYVVGVDRAPATPRMLATGDGPVALTWDADGQALQFRRNGELWRTPLAGGDPVRAPVTAGVTPNGVPSPDGARVAFVKSTGDATSGDSSATAFTGRGRGGRGGGGGASGPSELWIRTLSDGHEVRVAAEAAGIGGLTWSPDGAYLLFATGGGAIRHEQMPEYSGAKIVYTVTENVPGQSYAVPASGGTPVALPAGGFGPRRWLDTRHFVFDRTSTDYKRRTTSVVDVANGEATVLHEDVEPKFWSMTGDAGSGAQPSPDGKWIAFLSDRDGWDHLYIMPAAGGEPVQITKGRFEAWRPTWSHDSTRLAFDANEPDHPGDRHLGIVTLNGDPARATVTMITRGRGTDIAPQWSPDGTRLVYQHTDPHNSADLYVIDVPASAAPGRPDSASGPIRLTDSMPAGVDHSAFVEPEFVHYPGPDGQQVPGWLFVPKNLDRSKRHPAIVWIHGDGVNQNYDGWHVQRNYAVYYSFHQYLLQGGYVVFAPDYRGSIGYGKAWREGVYMDVGGNDAKDAWMAAGYLKTLGYVDAGRIGVWGLSYGGFFTLIAVTDQPKLYRAAVDVAGVVDYAMYYEDPYHGGWTASRIGTPEQNPKVYEQASPISHIDRLERPLLVLHGTADVNVPYLHSVRLLDEAMKKGKGDLVSFMVYPGEFHYFTRAHVLRDAWHRVEAFFEANLHPEAQATAH
jgi:dipeptidyl aminopeptidase/acylaminoacyl peptidase